MSRAFLIFQSSSTQGLKNLSKYYFNELDFWLGYQIVDIDVSLDKYTHLEFLIEIRRILRIFQLPNDR